MSDINPINNFSLPNTNPSQARDSNAQNLSNARANEGDSFQMLSSGSLSGKELTPLIKLLANRLQISELMAYKMVRKFMGTGQSSSFSEMRDFLLDFTKAPTSYEGANKQPVVKQLQDLNQKTNTNEIDKGFNNITKNLKDIFIQDKILKARTEGAKLLYTSQNQLTPNAKLSLTSLVTRPQEFASWLVNNKAAFIALRANPELTNIVIAMQNPQIQESPVLMAQLVALLVQILKLKAGKSPTEDIDEKAKADRDQAYAIQDSDHEVNIVNTVKETIESLTISPIKEFLIEAERFAEEEVANLWSITLKKERDLEKKLGKGLEKFRNKKK